MQNLFGVLDEVEQVTDEMYKNAEMLLDLYRKVKFRVYRNLEEIDEELVLLFEMLELDVLLDEIVELDETELTTKDEELIVDELLYEEELEVFS